MSAVSFACWGQIDSGIRHSPSLCALRFKYVEDGCVQFQRDLTGDIHVHIVRLAWALTSSAATSMKRSNFKKFLGQGCLLSANVIKSEPTIGEAAMATDVARSM